MDLTVTPRARALLVVLMLTVAAAAAGWLVLRTRNTDEGSAPAVTTTAKVHRASSTPATTPHRTATKPKATPAPGTQLPVALRRALATQNVVVVALYDPKAAIDGTALREAKAGAKLAGSSFVPVDVRKSSIAAVNARYGVMQDPAVLVLRSSGDVAVQIDGFADRDTVAQAAVNAGS